MGATGEVHYATPQIAAAAEEVARVAAQTEDNRLRSISIVTANAENFGGQGSDSFQQAINLVNQRYSEAQETIKMAGMTLLRVNDGMTEKDGMLAAQY